MNHETLPIPRGHRRHPAPRSILRHHAQQPLRSKFRRREAQRPFLYSQDLVIENSTPVNLSATLQRIITRLIVISTDPKPENVKDVRIYLSKGGTAFNPVTGFSSADAGFVNTISLNTAVGEITKLRTTLFIAALEDNLDVTLETLDASGTVLNTRMVNAVPFKRNRATFLTGSIFSASGSASFQLETDFEKDYYLDF